MEFLFWLSFFFILYTYVGYPCLLFFWSKLLSKKVNKDLRTPEPLVSVVVAARNEERQIRKRIENLLRQDYPPEKMEVIIVSDGSNDTTNDIVRQFILGNAKRLHNDSSNCALKLIELEESKGKANALNLGVRQAKGEFIVFADTRQEFEPNVITELIANFNDPKVGCVSGELIFYDDSESTINAEMDFYWTLEKRIRRMESAIHSVAGATGAIYAIRKSLFQTLPEETLLDDVFIPMNVVFRGFRTVFDGKAIAYDAISKNLSEEKRRKIRTLLGNYQLLFLLPRLVSPAKNPIFFRYLSHKVFRLFIPFFFFILLLSSFMAAGSFYKLVFIFAIVTMILSLCEKSFSSIPYLSKVSKLAHTFVSLNYFALISFCYFIWPTKKKLW